MSEGYWQGFKDGAIVLLMIVGLIEGGPAIYEKITGHIEQREPAVYVTVPETAEFEVLLGSANTGPSINGTLRIDTEDIPQFFDGHTWRLLPPPERESQ